MEIPIPEKRTVRLAKWIVIVLASILTITWLSYTPGGVLGKADAVGYAVCHRIETHSFLMGSQQMPLCARCSGMYLGALLGMVYQLRLGKRGGMPSRGKIAFFALLAAAFALDGVNSYLHFFPQAPALYQSQNWLRLITGTGMGLAISAMLTPAFNQTVWVDWENSPLLKSWRSVGALLVLAAVLDGLILFDIVWAMYVLALLSVLGVLAVLTLVYSMVWVMVFRIENRFARAQQLWVPLMGGFTLALVQIAVLDLGRFWLTGTWQGFTL